MEIEYSPGDFYYYPCREYSPGDIYCITLVENIPWEIFIALSL
jgi:hypothetical protein